MVKKIICDACGGDDANYVTISVRPDEGSREGYINGMDMCDKCYEALVEKVKQAVPKKE